MPHTEPEIERLALALFAAVNEHGRPNTFTPKELFEFHGAPSPMAQGRLIRNGLCLRLEHALRGLGWAGTLPTYSRVARRFYV